MLNSFLTCNIYTSPILYHYYLWFFQSVTIQSFYLYYPYYCHFRFQKIPFLPLLLFLPLLVFLPLFLFLPFLLILCFFLSFFFFALAFIFFFFYSFFFFFSLYIFFWLFLFNFFIITSTFWNRSILLYCFRLAIFFLVKRKQINLILILHEHNWWSFKMIPMTSSHIK